MRARVPNPILPGFYPDPSICRVGEDYYLVTSTFAVRKELTLLCSLMTMENVIIPVPILTHRHLGHDYPIVNVGHGDLVETHKGEWYMVTLASRQYGGELSRGMRGAKG